MKLENYFHESVINCEGYSPGEQFDDALVVKLNANENPYPPSHAVLSVLKEMADSRLRLYPESTSKDLRKKISEVYDWPVEGVLVGNGSYEILSVIFRACLKNKEVVQFPELSYSLYSVLAELNSATVRLLSLDQEWNLEFDNILPAARLTILGNPNSPVGNCFDPIKIKELCERVSGLIVIDEAYIDFSGQTCISLARSNPNMLILRTFSKSFSLAGIRLGFVLGDPTVISILSKVRGSYNVNWISEMLGIAALSTEGLVDMKRKVELVKSERSRVSTELKKMGFIVPNSFSNYLLAIHCKYPDLEWLYEALRKQNILVRYFKKDRIRNAIRVTIGGVEQNNRFIKIVSNLLTQKEKHV